LLFNFSAATTGVAPLGTASQPALAGSVRRTAPVAADARSYAGFNVIDAKVIGRTGATEVDALAGLLAIADPQPGEQDTILPLSVVEGMEWQARALCAQTDPEAFFPEKGGSTRDAKRVCLSCDVRSECLEYALENDERFGIWGGLSERERRRLKKQAV